MDVPEQRVNDVGGQCGGEIDRHEHPITLFEKRVDALFSLLSRPPISAFPVDAVRRSVEQNSPEDYLLRGYYVKWIYTIRDLLLEQHVISEDELKAVMADLEKAEAA